MKRNAEDAGSPGTVERQWSRRGWIGAVAGAFAAVTSIRRTRRETVVEKRRRRRFWIGHT
jgi:hypothetical protein